MAARVGSQRAVVSRLGPVGPASPGLFTRRSYARPHGLTPPDERLQNANFKTGEKNEWRLVRAVVFASGTTAEWTVDAPAGATLALEVAAAGPAEGNVPLEWLVDGAVVASSVVVIGGDQVTPWRVPPITLAAGTRRLALRSPAVAGARIALLDPVVTAPAPVPADNVLLVVVDALRADALGRVAAARKRAALFPTFARLGNEGVEFTQSFSVGNQTRLSTYAFLSGQWPRFGRFHSVQWDLEPEDKARYFAARPPLLGRLLAEAGARTATFGNDAFLFNHQSIGLDAAFDAVTDFRHSTSDTPWMTDAAIHWLEQHSGERFFLMVNYNAPHKPYEPPPEDRAAIDGGLGPEWAALDPDYLGEIHYTDRHLARLVEALDRLDLGKRTTVIVTSDHGEIFDERHKCYSPTYDRYCYRSHGVTLFDEELHVPLIVRQPGRFAPRAVDLPVSHVDLAPTVLALMGVAPDPLHLGRDLGPLLDGQTLPEVPIRSESRRSVALRYKGLKYVWHDPSLVINYRSDTLWDPSAGNEELYRLTTDPDETQTRALVEPSVTASMRDTLYRQDARHDRLRGQSARWVLEAGEAVGGQLTSLGRILDVEPSPGCRASADRGTLSLALAGGCTVRFATSPGDAGIWLEGLTIGTRPVTLADVGAGPLAIRLLESFRVETAGVRARFRAPDEASPPAERPAVWLRRVDTEVYAATPAAASSTPPADAEVRAMMQGWGYQ